MSSLDVKISSATFDNLLTPVTCSTSSFDIVHWFVVFFSQGHGNLMKHVRPYSRDATHRIFLVEPSTWPLSVGEMTVESSRWAPDSTDRLGKGSRI